MSNMIPAGLYRIANVAYPNRYISMLEDHFVGYNEGEIVCVHHHSNILPVLINAHRFKSKS